MKNCIRKRILFLESALFYKDLICLNESLFEVTFDGGSYKSDECFINHDLVIYTIYSSPKFNYILIKLKKLNIPTLLLFDGVAEFSNFYNNKLMQNLDLVNYHPVVSDYLAVIGDKAKCYFQTRGCKVIKFMPNHMKSSASDYFYPNKKVLITTANTAYFNEQEFHLLFSLIKEVTGLLQHSNTEYAFRIFDEKLIKCLALNADENFLSGSFDSVVKNFSHVITTPSSISLSAMKSNKAVAHFIYRDYPVFFQAGWNVVPGLFNEKFLRSFLDMDKDRMAFQYSEVISNFGCEDISDELQKIISDYEFSSENFHNKELFLMLDSKLNINFEYFFRKLYWKLKSSRFSFIMKKLRNHIVNK